MFFNGPTSLKGKTIIRILWNWQEQNIWLIIKSFFFLYFVYLASGMYFLLYTFLSILDPFPSVEKGLWTTKAKGSGVEGGGLTHNGQTVEKNVCLSEGKGVHDMLHSAWLTLIPFRKMQPFFRVGFRNYLILSLNRER